MTKFKVNIKTPGKKVPWKGMTLSTPTKLFIESTDVTRFKVGMRQIGIKEDGYEIKEVKEPTKGIVEANKKVEKQAVETAKVVSSDAKKEVKEEPKVEIKKEDAKKVETKPATKAEEVKADPKPSMKVETKDEPKDNKKK